MLKADLPNGIAPGLIETQTVTDSLKDFPPEERTRVIESWAHRQLFKRAAQPSEIASITVFLASDEASFLTGEIVKASAGWAAA